MIFVIKDPKNNIRNLTRKIGYYFLKEEKGELSFVRPLERAGFPRFHLYIKESNEDLIFNLHIDSKKPIYKGTPAHSGEYEGKVVEAEAERIKQVLRQNA